MISTPEGRSSTLHRNFTLELHGKLHIFGRENGSGPPFELLGGELGRGSTAGRNLWFVPATQPGYTTEPLPRQNRIFGGFCGSALQTNAFPMPNPFLLISAVILAKQYLQRKGYCDDIQGCPPIENMVHSLELMCKNVYVNNNVNFANVMCNMLI